MAAHYPRLFVRSLVFKSWICVCVCVCVFSTRKKKRKKVGWNRNSRGEIHGGKGSSEGDVSY